MVVVWVLVLVLYDAFWVKTVTALEHHPVSVTSTRGALLGM